MKKLLSFLFAGVLALGLIGCSGDLHDSEVDIHVVGGLPGLGWDSGVSMTNVGSVSTENGQMATYNFTATEDGTVSFKFKTANYANWTDDWAGDDKSTLVVTDNDNFVQANGRRPLGLPDTKNIEFTTVAGTSYVITAVYNPFGAKETLKFAIHSDGKAPTDTPVEPIVISYINGSPAGGNFDSLTKVSDSVYTYTFTFDKDHSNKWGEGEDATSIYFTVCDQNDWSSVSHRYEGKLEFFKNSLLHGNGSEFKVGNNNSTAEGLVKGEKYIITFTIAGTKLYGKFSKI